MVAFLMNEAYSFVELFCGEGWVSKVMRAGGHGVASLDIRLGEGKPGKENAFDLLTDSGFTFLDRINSNSHWTFLL